MADCEAEIEQTESAISILEAKMATPEGASDMALYEQHQKLKAQLDNVMEEWDAASSELEEARNNLITFIYTKYESISFFTYCSILLNGRCLQHRQETG